MRILHFQLRYGVAAAIALCLTLQGAELDRVRFNRDIRPILSDKCFTCHGPDKNKRTSPLRLDIEEGAFIELDEASLAAWEQREAVKERAALLQRAFEADENGGDFLGVRFYLLHSLSHLLLTAISLECGYAASAIRERIYCSKEGEGTMAGILLSTGTTGSEGTLGGLVEDAAASATTCVKRGISGDCAPTIRCALATTLPARSTTAASRALRATAASTSPSAPANASTATSTAP